MPNYFQGSVKGEGFRIAVVSSRFNREVTELLEAGAVQALSEAGVSHDDISVLRVPGAIEIPLAVKWAFELGFDGCVAVGAVIRGETSHYDLVCESVERGCTQLALHFGRPVGFGVITTENDEQAMDRAGGSHGNKGIEAAQVTLEMIQLARQMK